MNDLSLWGLVASLALLALGTSLKAVEALHAKKLAEDESARLRVQLESLYEPESKRPLDHQPVDAHPAARGAGDLNIAGGAGTASGSGGSVSIVGGSFKAGDAN